MFRKQIEDKLAAFRLRSRRDGKTSPSDDEGNMKICLIASISLAMSALALTGVSAQGNTSARSRLCTEYDVVSQTMEPCGTLSPKPMRQVVASKSSIYCSEYDIVSQSFVACDSVPRQAAKQGVKPSTDYCSRYDIVSQSFERCR
jgi:hypothetical protein